MIKPDFIFEASWEICNKVGGIYTVLSTKAGILNERYKDNYILLGPDIWKRTTSNPDFIEDDLLFHDWRKQAALENLKIRVGRWNIPSRPIAILVDFTTLFPQRNEVFAHLWEDYQLDSIAGGWDYIEPALFGYEAGRVIKSFYQFYLTGYQKVVAHFHEWMTGSGILYLKKEVEEVGTVFTTHATTLGRSIAGNNKALYGHMESYSPSKTASDLQVVSKHSLESIAARQADVLTTVSDITALECKQFLQRPPDFVTINGFDGAFVPDKNSFDIRKKAARQKLLDVAAQLFSDRIDENAVLILTSGRYEFRNKGIDLFIKSLEKLSENVDLQKQVVAFIMVPAGIKRPDESLESNAAADQKKCVTHILHNQDKDEVIRTIEKSKLNHDDVKVKVVFVPAYLNGKDGVFDMHYYNVLIGFDLTVFPSYYEPWGYTPMESIAFSIPTITTSYAGFGKWIQKKYPQSKSVTVIKRDEQNDSVAVEEIHQAIQHYINLSEIDAIKREAVQISQDLNWKQLIISYYEAWSLALKKAEERKEHVTPLHRSPSFIVDKPANAKGDKPNWKKILVKNTYPENLIPLKEMAMNLCWSWDFRAQELYESIDPHKWTIAEKNPLKLIESLSLHEINSLEKDAKFIKKLDLVYQRYKEYISRKKDLSEPLVAYFSMEYGLHNSIRIYSGGLGILAGDYLKQASDSNKRMVAVGLMYRRGYFEQQITVDGEQIAKYQRQLFSQLPLTPVKNDNNELVMVKVAIPGSIVYVKVWELKVGTINLYLLDTDTEENNDEDKRITYNLYGGNNETRLKQEMVLGIGGQRFLRAMNIEPDVYHLNEGHSAFLGLERIRHYIQKKDQDFSTAKELVRSSSLFTTHTPVPAGHDKFEEHLIRAYFSHYADRFHIDWEEFMSLGKINVKNSDEKFSMSILAMNLSQEVNGVSKIHGRVSREMFREKFPHYFAEEINIGHVTNGVHFHTWTAREFEELYEQEFGENFAREQTDQQHWEKIFQVKDQVIWEIHQKAKQHLLDEIKKRLQSDLSMTEDNPRFVFDSIKKLNKETLIIGFARRFATYKRAHLLFTNLEYLKTIVSNKKMPVIFLFAGKAHPSDKAGQDLIKKVIEVSKLPEFTGHVIFLENYNMELGHLMTSGVDVWLNTPTRPLEASGTSGEKAIMNGVMNFSVLDGWWAEGYQKDAGWAVKEKKTFEKQDSQNILDAEFIYETIREQIVKDYYNRNELGVSEKWVQYMKNTIARIAPHFNMQRMLEDYYRLYYLKLGERKQQMFADNFQKAQQLAGWKHRILQHWENVEVESLIIPDPNDQAIDFGNHFTAEVHMKLGDLVKDEIGVEVIMGNKTNGEVKEVKVRKELVVREVDDEKVVYACDFPLKNAGVYDYAFRIFPKHELLSSRVDFPLAKWA